MMVYVLSFAAALVSAMLINTLIVSKLSGTLRTGLKATSFVVCLALAIAFSVIWSIDSFLDSFIDRKIAEVETIAGNTLPGAGADIFDKPVNTAELKDIIQTIKQKAASLSGIRFIDSLFSKAVDEHVMPIIEALETETAAKADGSKGGVTVNAVLTLLKKRLLSALSPSFIAARLVVIGLLLVYVLICVGLAVSTRKGGAQYNKSITFGEQSGEERADGK